MPPGDSGDAVNIGATSFPMHISAKTENPDLAAAYLDWIAGSDAANELVAAAESAATDATVEMGHARPGGQGRLEPARRGRRADAVPRLVVADDAADDRPVVPGDARGSDLAQDVIDRVQSDWEEYHQELAGAGPRGPGGDEPGGRGARRAAAGRVRAPGAPRRVAYLYLAPAFVFYLLFAFGPLAYTTWLSFFEWDGLTVGTWIGLDNYEQILSGDDIRASFVHLRADPLLRGAAGRARPAARVADHAQPRTGRDVLPRRAVHATDDRARDRRDRLDVDLRAGGAAQRGARRGRPRLGLARLARRLHWALPALGLVGTWIMFGLCLVLFLAGIQKIPQSLYEAARVDGAGRVREFFAVTLPGCAASWRSR